MDWKSFWSGMFQSAAEAEGTPIAAAIEPRQLVPGESLTAAALPATSSITSSTAILQSVDPERDAREERIAALEAQLAKQEAAQIQARAEAFADNAVRAHQALPAERGALVSLYVQAATDDSHDGGGRVAQVEALIVARPAHNLTQEAVAVGAGGVLETTAPKELTDARRQQLLSMTPTGQAALARRSRTA